MQVGVLGAIGGVGLLLECSRLEPKRGHTLEHRRRLRPSWGPPWW